MNKNLSNGNKLPSWKQGRNEKVRFCLAVSKQPFCILL